MLDWIDLPSDNYVAILGYQTAQTIELDALIKKYSSIPKDKIETLSCRIRKLNQIIDFIHHWITNSLSQIDKKKHLNWISDIATNKRNYLSALLDIYTQNKHLESFQQSYHHDTQDLTDPSKLPIFLHNDRFFSLKMKEYWGDFWYETLDPCHRRLTPFLDQWRALKRHHPDIPHFFLWLETIDMPKYVPRVTYLKDIKLEETRLVVKDGLFWNKSNSEWSLTHFANSSKRFLFAINLQGEIFAAEETHGISHSSFTSGKPVLGAGLLQIEHGQLSSIALESGHYMPTIESGYQIIKILEEKGVRFPEVLALSFFYDRNKYSAAITHNPHLTLQDFKLILEKAYQTHTRGCHDSTPFANAVL